MRKAKRVPLRGNSSCSSPAPAPVIVNGGSGGGSPADPYGPQEVTPRAAVARRVLPRCLAGQVWEGRGMKSR